MTEGLLSRLSRVASSTLPNAALVNDADRISVGDIREVMRLLADRDGWRTAYESTRADAERLEATVQQIAGCHVSWVWSAQKWQKWSATLLDEHGRQPLHGQHGDEPAREVIAQLVGLAPGVPRCSRCGCFSTRHEVDDEELRECADCECEFETRPYVSTIVLELRDETFSGAVARVLDIVERAGVSVRVTAVTKTETCPKCGKESVWTAPEGQNTAHVKCLYCKEPMEISWDAP